MEAIQPRLDANGHTLCFALVPLRVEGDGVRLTQAISNLLHNAAKYTRQGGTIRLTMGAEDGHAIVRVIDSGAGIEPQLLPTLFDLFVQGDRSLDRSEGGLGIGLTVARTLVEMPIRDQYRIRPPPARVPGVSCW